MWVDSHAHLDDSQFKEDLSEVIDRARAAHVGQIVTVGTDEQSTRKAVAIATEHSGIFSTVGCHPHEADKVDAGEVLKWLTDLGRDPKVVAVGETGLDLYKNYAEPENQERLFLAHLAAAAALTKPIVIHCRNAHPDCLAILEREQPPNGGVIHCFSGSADDARRYLDLNFIISIAGPVTYPNAGGLREAVKTLPADRILVETDCPYLAPQARRGKRNEPAFVPYTGARVAELLGQTPEAFAERSTRAARELFALP